jgi:hypothetical protein
MGRSTAGNDIIEIVGTPDMSLGTLLAGEDLPNGVIKIEQRFSYATISTATTTTIKSGAGFLHSIVVTGGTAGTVIVYDNTAGSGTKIADFDSTNAIAAYSFNVSFTTGLTIVTGAATKITINYR